MRRHIERPKGSRSPGWSHDQRDTASPRFRLVLVVLAALSLFVVSGLLLFRADAGAPVEPEDPRLGRGSPAATDQRSAAKTERIETADIPSVDADPASVTPAAPIPSAEATPDKIIVQGVVVTSGDSPVPGAQVFATLTPKALNPALPSAQANAPAVIPTISLDSNDFNDFVDANDPAGSSDPNDQVMSAVADDVGRFSFTLSEGHWEFSAASSGWISPEAVAIEVRRGTPLDDVRLVLEPGAFIHGTVIAAADRSSIPDCVATSSPAGAKASCGRSGRFVLGPLPLGTVTLSVHAPGFVARDADLRLERPGNTFIELALVSGGKVEGRVVGLKPRSLSEPVRLRTVHYALGGSSDQGHVTESTAVADETGYFLMEDVAPGRLHVRASIRGRAEAKSREVVVASGRTADIGELRFQDGIAISGEVVLPDGSPVAGARVVASRPGDGAGEDDGKPSVFDVTDESGWFDFDGLTEGEWVLTATSPVGAGLTRIHATDGANVRLVIDGGSITGTVRDASGAGISGARIRAVLLEGGGLFASSTASESDGAFRFDGLPQGVFRLHAQVIDGGNVAGEVERRGVRTGDDVVLVIAGNGRIEGQVSDDAGRVVTDFAITLIPTSGDSVGARYRTIPVLSGDGSFTVEAVTPGSYSLRASAPGHSSTNTIIRVQADDVTTAKLQLGPGASLSGMLVVGNDRSPVPDCQVREEAMEIVSGLPERHSTVATTDVRGLFELNGVEAGVRRVVASCPDGGHAETGVRINPGEHREIVLRVTNEEPEVDEYAGIGAVLSQRREGVVIHRLTEGGPGFLAGIRPGDVVLAVDGQSVVGASLGLVSERIRGPEGVPVHLILQRDGGAPFEVVSERVRIAVR